MAFTHVLGPAGIGASLQGARDSNPLLRGQIEILLCVPAVGFTKTPARLDDPFHEKILTAQGEIRKKESGGRRLEVGGQKRSEDREQQASLTHGGDSQTVETKGPWDMTKKKSPTKKTTTKKSTAKKSAAKKPTRKKSTPRKAATTK